MDLNESFERYDAEKPRLEEIATIITNAIGGSRLSLFSMEQAVSGLLFALGVAVGEREKANHTAAARTAELREAYQQRDEALEGRNTWAKNATALRSILETTATALELEDFPAFAARLRESLAATEPTKP